MTDDEADAWFLAHAQYSMKHVTGMTAYDLWRQNTKCTPENSVGFVIPETAPHPDPKEVQRFMVRWFVSAFGA